MEENILASIKEAIGNEAEYTHFDKPIIMAINSAFAILHQLGVGPKLKPFALVDGSETWDEFMTANDTELVKSYIAIKVQKMFDPPSNSFLMTALNEMEKEYEWRLNVDAENDLI